MILDNAYTSSLLLICVIHEYCVMVRSKPWCSGVAGHDVHWIGACLAGMASGKSIHAVDVDGCRREQWLANRRNSALRRQWKRQRALKRSTAIDTIRRISAAPIRGLSYFAGLPPDSASLHPGLYSGAPYQGLKKALFGFGGSMHFTDCWPPLVPFVPSFFRCIKVPSFASNQCMVVCDIWKVLRRIGNEGQ